MTSQHRIALYPGSFDPLTRGHEDLIRRSLVLADRVVVAIAVNINKTPLFTTDERLAFIREAMRDEPRVEVQAFSGLLVDFARTIGATINVRGVRVVNDFESESQMAHMNRKLYPSLETVFLTPSTDTSYISSSLVREVARFGGDVSPFVHPVVARALADRFRRDG